MLAAATALPEISSGIAAVRLGDYTLEPIEITAGTPVIVAARHSAVWLGAAGLLMTGSSVPR